MCVCVQRFARDSLDFLLNISKIFNDCPDKIKMCFFWYSFCRVQSSFFLFFIHKIDDLRTDANRREYAVVCLLIGRLHTIH